MRSSSCPFAAAAGLGVAVGGVTEEAVATGVGVAPATLSSAPGLGFTGVAGVPATRRKYVPCVRASWHSTAMRASSPASR
eukprot:3346523-Pleurochrysis_carterae.AAC.1